MTSALTATRPQVTGGPSGLRYAHPTRRGAAVRLAQQSYSDRIVRLVTAAPIVAAAGMVVVQLALTWSTTASLPTTGVAAALVACYLPFHLHHVWAAAHARRPHSGGWTLAAMAVIIAAGTPLVGYAWLTTWVQLLVSVLIVLPRPWSVFAGGVLVAALGPLNILLGNENSPIWLVLVLLERTCAVLVPAWLSGALRQLRAARADLAAHAVLQERIRIDGELAGRDRAAAERSLRALVDGSRGALAATRRIISAYQRVSLRAELDTAAALLNASGIRTSLVLPSGDLPEPAGGELTRSLRSAVDRLLRTAAVRGCEINVVRTAERLRLTVRARRRAIRDGRRGDHMTAPGYPQWIVRRAGWFLLALHLPIVVMPLLLVTTGGMTDHDLAQGVFAVVVIPVMGLLHLRHILAAARGDRPVGWQWTLLAQALLVYLPMPWVGVDWAASTLPLMASAMLMLPGRRGVAIGFGVPFAASGVMYVWQLIAHLNGREQIVESVYFVIIITVFGFALYGTVRLVRLVNELDGTHTELAHLAVDRERVRVSRDLHDLLGQSLSAISLKGDLAIRLLSIDADGARAEIAGLTEVARTALRDVRAVTRDEHRVALREEIAAAAALLAAAGVDTRIDTPNTDLALPGVGEQVLAWAVREGTTNLLRHSAASTASTATITLARAGGVVRLEMINDRAPARAPGAGTGLAGLRERAAALGGATTAGVTPEGGFRLRVTIPATGEVT